MVESNDPSEDVRALFERYMQQYPAQARVQHYLDVAEKRLESEKDSQVQVSLRWLVTYATSALQALKLTDLDAFAQAFERVMRLTVELNIPALEKATRSSMGSKGGKVSKRPKGALRRILEDICTEIESTSNKDVMRYWQKYSISFEADNAPEGTCWFKHSLRAVPTRDCSLPDMYEEVSRQLDETVSPLLDELADGDYKYRYFDDDEAEDPTTDADAIRKTMYRIRKSH